MSLSRKLPLIIFSFPAPAASPRTTELTERLVFSVPVALLIRAPGCGIAPAVSLGLRALHTEASDLDVEAASVLLS